MDSLHLAGRRTTALAALALTLALAAASGAAAAHAGGVTVKPVCPAVSPGYARCLSLVKGNGSPLATGPSGLVPADLQSAYNLPSVTAGAGQTVAIVDAFDDPTAERISRSTARPSACRPAPRRRAASAR